MGESKGWGAKMEDHWKPTMAQRQRPATFETVTPDARIAAILFAEDAEIYVEFAEIVRGLGY